MGGGIALLLLGTLLYFTIGQRTSTRTATTAYTEGITSDCYRRPNFMADLPIQGAPGMSTVYPGWMGFVMFQPGDTQGVFQHPSWDDAGFLGGSVQDTKGNMYFYASPFGSTENNRPIEQNKVHILDTNTAILSEWIDLPPLAQPNETVNPYGLTGIFHDCDTESLYVASVMGSTAQEENGRIFQIDLSTGEVLDTYDNIDALGVGTYNGANGKRLYFGLARNASVLSIGLDENGNFIEEDTRLEFALTQLEGGRNERGQRIHFPRIGVEQYGNMIIKGIEFNFTLRAAGVAELTNYEFVYQPETDSWEFVSLTRP